MRCHMHPLGELGDVLKLAMWVRAHSAGQVRFSMSESELMTVTLRIQRPL